MKTIKIILFLVILGVGFTGCTIVMPTAETASKNNKTPSTSEAQDVQYTRPTPTTTVGTSAAPTRPRPNREEATPTYTRPTTTTPTYSRPVTSTTTSKNTESTTVADTTKQVRSRVRR